MTDIKQSDSFSPAIEQSRSMPKGWEIKKLGEVCEIMNGGTPDTTVPRFWDGENLWITPKDMGKLESIYVDDTFRKITDDGLKNSSAKILPPNSIILSSRAPIGHLAVNTKPISTNQGCKGLVPHKGVGTLYLYYFLSNSVDLLNGLGTGATFKELSGLKLGSVEIPLPPLNEQLRIVSILDEAFAAIATAKANAEQNLKNAKYLFESYLQRVFEKKGEGWEQRRVQDISKIANGYAFASKDFQSTNTIKSIKITNVGVKEFVEETDNYLPEKFKGTFKEFQVKNGDIVIALTRTIIAAGLKVAVVPESYDGALINQRVAVLVPNEKLVNRRFLYNFLTTTGVSKYVLAHVNTLMQPNLSINDLKNLLVPCPPLTVQQSIVQNLDALSAETKRLETIYQQKLINLEELKKSVLQKAFNGELITNKK
ncbi:MAG TPA: restriction endonuclease subunit S [Prolixibacteraceae bacterium]